jgi:hypothetical protein
MYEACRRVLAFPGTRTTDGRFRRDKGFARKHSTCSASRESGMFPIVLLACVWAAYGHLVSFWVYRFDAARDLDENESPFLA